MTIKSFPSTLLLLLLSTLLVTTEACKKNPVDPDDDHEEAEGLVLRMNGVDIVTVKEGVVTGNITVQAGRETSGIEVYFLDHDGRRFQPESQDFSLGWRVFDETVAAARRSSTRRWEFHIEGKRAGQTSIEVQLLHSGHVDFRTPPVPILVTQ